MTERSKSMASANRAGVSQAMPIPGEAIMKSIIFSALALLTLTGISMAKELPDAPSAGMTPEAYIVESSTPIPAPRIFEKKPIDATFLSLAVISTGSTFADSFTTLFARQNWLAGKKGVCNMEVQSAYLYGTHPTVGRAYAVASAKSAASIFAAYYLRKHHSRFWSAPLVTNSILSLQGVTQNMMACN
jgi:hypothetical protein